MNKRVLAAIGLGLTMAFAPNLRAENVDEKFAAEHSLRSISKEVQSLEKKAVDGNARAQFKLGEMYEHGQGGLAKDMSYAMSWYEEAAHNGNKQAKKKLRSL